MCVCVCVYKSKVGDHSQGQPEGFSFQYLLHWVVGEGSTLFKDCATLPLILTL